MKGLGAFIVLAIIALQGVAAIVAGIKKQKARAIAEAGNTPNAPPAPEAPTPRSVAAKREALIQRRRQQIDELRSRAQKSASSGRPPAPPTQAPRPVQAPVAMPAVTTAETPRVDEPESAYARERFAYARKKSHGVSKARSLLRGRASLRNAFILKELIDPPVALRTNSRDLH